MTEPQTRRLAAILAADVVGYSRLMGADEAGVLAALQSLRAKVFDPIVAAHRGRIVKLMGDGTLVEFASVVDAVTCAAEIQRALAQRSATLPEDRQLHLRIGINLGDVIVDGDDLYGDGVNVAARLEGLAEPGGICVSTTVFEHVKGRVAVGFEDLGERKIKNIRDPVRVYRVVPDASSSSLPTSPTSRTPIIRPTAIAAMLAVLAALAGFALWQRPSEPRVEPASEARMAFPLPDKPSIAVLPFDDLSEDTSQEFFADGMTEDLITDLSKISGLFVIARNSTFQYKDAPVSIKRVAEDLGVRYVLEGSVRRSGDILRVNAQLIDASTGGHVWADRFDGNVDDAFTVQDQFVLKIVNALELKLSDREKSEISRVDTRTLRAKEAFQQGWELYSRFNEKDNARAATFFEQAIELDPEYGRAYGALALVYLRGAVFHDWDKAIGQSDARLYREYVPIYLKKAVEHETALLHVVRAMQHLNYRDHAAPEGTNRGTDDARREAGKAIALQPNDPEAHITMAWALIAAGKPKEGLSFIDAAIRLNPNFPSHYVLFRAAAHYAMGELDRASEMLRQGLDRDPEAVGLAPMAASIYAQLGDRQSARATVERWRPDRDQSELETAAEQYFFVIRWVNEHQLLNARLHDGLRLAALPEEVSVASLLQDFHALDPSERHRAVRKIGWFGPAAAQAVPDLIAALGSDQKLVRKEAVIALGKIGPEASAAIPLLEARIGEPIIGYHAKGALRRIGTK